MFSVERFSFRNNQNLEDLYLVGNPCSAFKEYRNFVMTVLPQITALDGVSIDISERILAKQRWQDILESILVEEQEYLAKREKEKQEVN